jgi:glycosyltransferase involved in cell wall biosynthesis
MIFGDQYGQACGTVTDTTMAKWYGVLDLLSNATYGEGFGCPVLDAQMCGTPVVVADNSTGPELCGAGWAVATEPYWNRGHSSWWGRPSVAALIEAYEQASEKAAGLREQAREFALQYDADRVTETYWKPALAALEAGLKPANRASQAAAPKPAPARNQPGIFAQPKLKPKAKGRRR